MGGPGTPSPPNTGGSARSPTAPEDGGRLHRREALLEVRQGETPPAWLLPQPGDEGDHEQRGEEHGQPFQDRRVVHWEIQEEQPQARDESKGRGQAEHGQIPLHRDPPLHQAGGELAQGASGGADHNGAGDGRAELGDQDRQFRDGLARASYDDRQGGSRDRVGEYEERCYPVLPEEVAVSVHPSVRALYVSGYRTLLLVVVWTVQAFQI